jgi:two-component system sensor histidine kinase VicK
VVKNNVDRLAWLVQNLQRIARIDNDLDGPSEQRVDVAILAGEVRRQLDDMALARNVEIRIDPALPTVVVDPARLELVLLNLVSNGVKYRNPAADAAFVAVEVVDSPSESRDTWRFSVRDNGLGIPAECRDAVFQRFVRAHEHLDAALGVSGSGLGLSIVVDCVEALGGSIECESAIGEGTRFTVTLPTRSPR